MNQKTTKFAVLMLVVLLALGASTVDMSLGVFSDSETLGSGDIVAGTETTSEPTEPVTTSNSTTIPAEANTTVTTSETG